MENRAPNRNINIENNLLEVNIRKLVELLLNTSNARNKTNRREYYGFLC